MIKHDFSFFTKVSAALILRKKACEMLIRFMTLKFLA